ADAELEAGMLAARDLDHARREVDADAARRLERGQEVAGGRADLEDARALGDEELRQPLDLLVVVAVLGAEAVALVGERVEAGDPLGARPTPGGREGGLLRGPVGRRGPGPPGG